MVRKYSAAGTQRIIKWCIVIGVLVLAGLAVTKVVFYELRSKQLVSLGSTVFRADIADNPKAREKGLGGRASLASDEAMLFVFDSDGFQPVWMRGMKFPVDIVWLDSNKEVVHLEENIQPDAFPYNTYESPVSARYVLEIAAGQVERSRVNLGGVAKFDIASEGL